ncbi:FecR family protein [Acetobacter conturbans]|uniref:DUF4880 domain-containing protein n=1 Tax=Acetobacter conturbans TaxID=1737472 RepID=A0ABX0K5P9_9PROT|nr:FecR family protein [Acetobacter conturbans]NHN89495.1 DUF4880 domain-containing protein [Acetobacter conturbans]
MTDTTDDQQDRIDAEAAEWVIRRGGSKLTLEEQQAFDTWRSASSLHDAAFRRASGLWSDLDVGGREKKAHHRRASTHVTAAGMAGLFVLGLGIGAGWVEPARWFADYTTGRGEIRTVQLDDGSIAELDSHAALSIRYSANERRVLLIGGEAYFTVAPVTGDEHRPFVVEAAGGTSTALGTQFMVAREGSDVDTTVTEHNVRVTAQDRSSRLRSVIVSEGQKVHYDRDGLGGPHEVPTAILTAWRTGQIVFDNEPLSGVIDRLNRYRHGRIVLAKRSLVNRRVSGVFACADVESALTTISQELHLKTISVGGLVTVIY